MKAALNLPFGNHFRERNNTCSGTSLLDDDTSTVVTTNSSSTIHHSNVTEFALSEQAKNEAETAVRAALGRLTVKQVQGAISSNYIVPLLRDWAQKISVISDAEIQALVTEYLDQQQQQQQAPLNNVAINRQGGGDDISDLADGSATGNVAVGQNVAAAAGRGDGASSSAAAASISGAGSLATFSVSAGSLLAAGISAQMFEENETSIAARSGTHGANETSIATGSAASLGLREIAQQVGDRSVYSRNFAPFPFPNPTSTTIETTEEETGGKASSAKKRTYSAMSAQPSNGNGGDQKDDDEDEEDGDKKPTAKKKPPTGK